MCITRERYIYAIAILTSPLHRVNSALHRGTNISKSEIITKWSVFPGMVTYIIAPVKVEYGWILYEWADVFREPKASENTAPEYNIQP